MATPADRALELVAQRQVRRRGFNDRLAALGDFFGEATPYRCECGLVACGAAIKLTADEYAQVRAEPRHFAVLAAHVLPEAERIVARHRGWVTVEKPPGAAAEIAACAVSRPAAWPPAGRSSPTEPCEHRSGTS